jgi:hypothetical protein
MGHSCAAHHPLKRVSINVLKAAEAAWMARQKNLISFFSVSSVPSVA